MESLSRRKWREFSVGFKEAAARRLLSGESGTALSRELDVRRSVLYRWRDERIGKLERLLGQQAAELDFFEQAFRALHLATPGSDASGASGSTELSSRSAPKAHSVSNRPVNSDE